MDSLAHWSGNPEGERPAMKVCWTVYYGKFRKSEYTFQGTNGKRDAQRLAKRLGGRVVRDKVN